MTLFLLMTNIELNPNPHVGGGWCQGGCLDRAEVVVVMWLELKFQPRVHLQKQ